MQAYCILKPPQGPTFLGSDGLISSDKICSRSVGCTSIYIKKNQIKFNLIKNLHKNFN